MHDASSSTLYSPYTPGAFRAGPWIPAVRRPRVRAGPVPLELEARSLEWTDRVRWSPDGRWLVAGRSPVWTVPDSAPGGLPEGAEVLAVGDGMVCTSQAVYRLGSGELLHDLLDGADSDSDEPACAVAAAAFSAGDRLCAYMLVHAGLGVDSAPVLYVYGTEDWSWRGVLQVGSAGMPAALCFSTAGGGTRLAVTAMYGQEAYYTVWTTTQPETYTDWTKALEAPYGAAAVVNGSKLNACLAYGSPALSFSPDGSQLACTRCIKVRNKGTGSVSLYRTDSWAFDSDFEFDSPVRDCCFSPSGWQLLVAVSNGTIQLFIKNKLGQWAPRSVVPLHSYSCNFSPDGLSVGLNYTNRAISRHFPDDPARVGLIWTSSLALVWSMLRVLMIGLSDTGSVLYQLDAAVIRSIVEHADLWYFDKLKGDEACCGRWRDGSLAEIPFL